MTQYQSITTNKLPESLQPKKGKLILTKELQDQIDFLHDKVGNIEWCGVLFHEKVSGEITDPESLVLKAKYIYLMDIGSHAYTEAKFTPEVIMEMHEEVPDAEDLIKGLIHTHHSMSAFFSGTDMAELHDNAPLYNYYLSLIVNNAGTYVARVAYVATEEKTLTLKNPNSDEQPIISESEVLVMIDLEIVKEPRRGDTDSFFSSRYEVVQKEVEEAKKAKVIYTGPTYTRYTGGSYSSFYNPHKYDHPKANPGLWEDTQDWIEGYPAEEEIKKDIKKKEGSLPKIAKDGTKLHIEEKEFHDLVFSWLETGLDVYPDMLPKKTPTTIKDLLSFYDDYFNVTTDLPKLEYFCMCLTKMLPIVFNTIHPNLVRKKGNNLMENYEDVYYISRELYAIFDSYPEYLKTLKQLVDESGK